MTHEIRSTDSPEDANIIASHRKLKKELAAHREEFSNHLKEYAIHRKELCEDYAKSLEFSKEVNKTAVSALELSRRTAESTAVLVEGATTVQSLVKFIKWSGSSVVLVAALTWLAAKFSDWAATFVG